MKGALLGHINCPSCGTAKGMRVTTDKNGDPFGFCEAKCGQQLRVGGNSYRVAEFKANHKHLFPPVTVTVPVPARQDDTAPDHPALPVQVQKPVPTAAPTAAPTKPQKSTWFNPILSKAK